ncbi:MAG: glycosyltransferase family 4 protein [Clostridia bacterium]|nr:glycosyltransferase family 4 protein [Clostridia bacterium]
MVNSDKRIMIIVAASNMVLSFRSDLIKKFQSEGYSVAVVAFDNLYEDKIESLGVKFYCAFDNNRNTSPLKILSLKKKYVEIIKDFNPEIVFTFMLKPNTFGTVAAKEAGVKKVFSMVEGAGDVFIKTGFKWKIIRKVVCHLYKKAFKISKKVFFLNNDDKNEFINRKIVSKEKCEIVHGIGVNLDKFDYKPVTNTNTFLMVARMLKTKGVIEYCKCARLVKEKHSEAVFNYLGQEGDITLSDIQEYIDDGSINYLGAVSDVRPYLEQTTVMILPSYREGFPMSIMEAQAVGRAIITHNVTGCKETVKDGYNGFLVEKGDYVAMVEKAIWCLENADKTREMCQNARAFAEQNFDQVLINKYIFDLVQREN